MTTHDFSHTFTDIHELTYDHVEQNEHIWQARAGGFEGFLAAAPLGTAIVRVRLIRGTTFDTARYQLVDGAPGSLPYHSWIVVKGDEQWTQPPGMSPESLQQQLATYLTGFAATADKLRLKRPLTPDECIFGLGERIGPMNNRGQSFPVWNIDPAERAEATDLPSMYTSIPFYIGLQPTSGQAYGVLIDHTGYLHMDMGRTEENAAAVTIEGDHLVAYFFSGPTLQQVMQQYTELTGRMPMPPRWALGHHQCRWGYQSAQEISEIARTLRERNHPGDSLWLDIDYMRGYRCFTWNTDTFPEPAQLAESLHQQGFKMVTIIDPGIKIDEQYHVYQQLHTNQYACRYPDGKPFEGNVWPGRCVFPDYSRAEVRRWWGDLYKELLDIGVDGIWNDMNEPALTNQLLEGEQPFREGENTMDGAVLHQAGGEQPTGEDGPPVTHRFFHNAYGMEMARATREGLQRLRPDERPFVLSRAGTAGIQRYAAIWTGDNTSKWEHLSLAIRMCLNMSMSGVPFVGSDIGGFWKSSTGELLTRFAQLGAFLPFSRNHNARDTHAQEPWAFGEPYESAYRKAIETRYRLFPYLYTLFHQAATTGSPILRPLFYHYPKDEHTYEDQDAFLIGDTLLSAPVTTEGATEREVYLPEGRWFDYWDGTEYPGRGVSTIPAPLDRWPLLVRSNSILPSMPLVQNLEQLPSETLTFTCYMAVDGLATYTLYEDDGRSLAYQKGEYALTSVSCRVDRESITIRIDEHHERYNPHHREYEIVVLIGNQTYRERVRAGQGSSTLRIVL
ncbi:alpha-glucosidase [Thermosporothrix hazakensis]|jgi:alpha-glucosidase|uniref:Alpha-glucosidase n=2 Tax=Thermosporothrix TaxID=768650 RepID=A0A326UEB1_THEHA|nr:TIM-barrel domain-containing protein [Thermosporothrix hazakensis]PZW24852.1 alpha-glucosidase [Thermosporothrix hazakensis]BBH88272.1 alpha-glucosidase [Thermosporothrix sp. COM3]GCE46459.1 alpha-glucosidase [Thermosporothrix hazakensis]